MYDVNLIKQQQTQPYSEEAALSNTNMTFNCITLI